MFLPYVDINKWLKCEYNGYYTIALDERAIEMQTFSIFIRLQHLY